MTSTIAEFDPTAFENFDLSAFKEEQEDSQEEEIDQSQTVTEDAQPQKQATVFVIDCSAVVTRQLPQKLFEVHQIVKKEEEDEDGLWLANQQLSRATSIWQVLPIIDKYHTVVMLL